MPVKEQHYRSVMKGASWRVVGTVDTMLLSWVFTGVPGQALAIGAVELFTKIGLYYLHERLWLGISWGCVGSAAAGGVRESHVRSVVKGLSWRMLGTLDTTLIAWLVTGNSRQALSIGLTEIITKVGLYYLHERAWHRIELGRHGG